MTELNAGDAAPDFSLKDADGKTVSLADFAGRRVIVYFYPAALTAGCTIEAIDFTHARKDFAQAGVDVIGISPDQPEKLARFREKEDLNVTLLSDPEKTTIEAYGAWGVRKLYGKEVTGVIRSTFVVDVDADGKGTVESAQRNVRARGHVERLGKQFGLQLNLPEVK